MSQRRGPLKRMFKLNRGSQLILHKEPTVKNPRLVVAWGCIGEVGIEAATYLRDKLGAEEFGEIEPYDFFEVPTLVKDGVIEKLDPPETKFYHWKNGTGGDLIICMADFEPPNARYEYVNLILDLAERFKVKRLYTVCAFPTTIHHTSEPRVIGVANNAKLIKYLEEHHIMLMMDRDLNTMNGLLLGLAKKRGIEGIYLLGEVPAYAVAMANPKSCKAVLGALAAMLGVDVDMTEIEETLRQTEGELDKRMREASSEFLDHFTIDYRDFFEDDGSYRTL
ncbi:PAC2 family protein [Chloroflexota bacterium]